MDPNKTLYNRFVRWSAPEVFNKLKLKLHAVYNGNGKPVGLLLTAGQVREYTGAKRLLSSLPYAKELLPDRRYDADWYRNALQERGISPCTPPRKNRKAPISYDKELYKQQPQN